MLNKNQDRYGRYNSLRLCGHDYANTHDIYFITIDTIARASYFADIVLAKQVTALLLDLHLDGRLHVFAYCLMPDHLHALLKVTSRKYPLSDALGLFKSKSTSLFWKRARNVLSEGSTSFYGQFVISTPCPRYDGTGTYTLRPEFLKIEGLRPCYPRAFQSKRLWQESFHDHIIRDEDDFQTKVDYTLDNPVRRKYVPERWMYPFSGVLES